LSLKTKVDGLSAVWPQNYWDGLSVVWPQNHWDDFSCFGLKIGGNGLSRFGIKTSGSVFFGLGLKIGSYDLVVWVSKSLRQFVGLSLKNNRAIVYWLRHKTDRRMKTVQGTRRDLAVCFTWKQVALGFFSLDSRLVET
jgi:hypothetical protein